MRLFVIALLALMGISHSVVAQNYNTMSRGLGLPDRLTVASLPEGGTKVIVELADHSQGVLGTTAIERVQDMAIRTLGLQRADELVKFKYMPAIGLVATPQILSILQRSPLVQNISVDDVHVVNLRQSTQMIHAPEVWKQGYAGAKRSVAVLDTGVNTSHAAFGGLIKGEACFSSNGRFQGNEVMSNCPNAKKSASGKGTGKNCSSRYSGCDHGTHVAGIAAGGGGSSKGVAPAASVVAVQVFSRVEGAACGRAGRCVTAYTSDIIQALEWVYDKRDSYAIAAVNMSLGGGRYKSSCDGESIARAIHRLYKVGIPVVIAAGNEGYRDSVANPACVSRAVTVGSTDKRDRLSSFSNSNKIVDIWAPGGSIRAAVPGGSTGVKSGTSMAAPHVAGAFAVLRARYPNAAVDELIEVIEKNGPMVTDSRNGLKRHRLDLAAAMKDANKRWGDGEGGTSPTPDKDDGDGGNGGGLGGIIRAVPDLLGGGRN